MVLLSACAAFLGSFLLFALQPIVAKRILPWFGGSPAVWTTCLVFFQFALLAGYFYAHRLIAPARPSQQFRRHAALLAASLALLPILPGPFWQPKPGGHPTLEILALLTVVIGLPYLLLAASTPLVQSWYARAACPRPYRLYALSNLASLAALLAYPLFIEPRLPLRVQGYLWSAAYVVFAVLCASCAWLAARAPAVPPAPAAIAAPHGPHAPAAWLLLPAAASMLLVATTSQLTQNVAPVPLLWIVPLALYLLSFVLAFASPRFTPPALLVRLTAVALASSGYAIYDIHVGDAIVIAAPVFLLTLLIACLYCHGELARRKPAPARLTSFYLHIAAGGALGGLAAGLFAPLVFSGVYDLALSLAAVAAVALWLNWRAGWPQRLLWAAALAAMLVVLNAQIDGYGRNAILLTRDFYGTLRVVRSSMLGAEVRTLYHGSVEHGAQWFLPERRMTPASYYSYASGAGLALRGTTGAPRRVGVIGLGAGTLAAYGRAGDVFRFYEIDPHVIAVAESLFTYLRESRARIEIAPGDARLSLEHEPPLRFDVLAVDAFSGDAIPAHLLTREAFALYLGHLEPGGILAVHVSNQYLDLAPMVASLAHLAGYPCAVVSSAADPKFLVSAAEWVLISRDEEFWRRADVRAAARPVSLTGAPRPWTDDYNGLLGVLRNPFAATRARRDR